MDNQNGSSDGEDIPSDFFDDFAKDEFIEGLSVVDSWDDSDKKLRTLRSRINSDDLTKVKDLRDLIVREKQGDRIIKDKYRWRRIAPQPGNSTFEEHRSGSASRMDSYIKPGSRRDPSKTIKAIKKDKEEKVKEYLAKHLESSDDIRPPGTELDDFFDAKKVEPKKQPIEPKASMVSPLKERPKIRRETPVRRREAPPQVRRQYWSPRRPHGVAHSPRFSPRRSPRRFSPRRGSPRRFSPRHFSPRHFSPRRYSPRRPSPSRNFYKNQRNCFRRSSPDFRRRKSRSPMKQSFRQSHSRSTNYREQEMSRRSRSPSQIRRQEEDDFLYPKNYYPPEFDAVKNDIQYSAPAAPQYSEPKIVEYAGGVPPGFSYPQGTPYPGYAAPYEYGVPPVPQVVMTAPQPVPAPILPSPIQGPVDMTSVVAPAMVPPPQQITSQIVPKQPLQSGPTAPADALAKLVADGVISHEDYLKLVPNKGVTHTGDTNIGAAVLNRCNTALSKIGNIMVPTRLIINNNMLTAGPEKNITPPKFSSPLKRQPVMQFHFTKTDASTIKQRNKQIVETLLTTLNLENVVGKSKKRLPKDMKDAETQTTKPFCDVCEIRESTTFNEMGTSIDREHIFSSVHTQVVEHDLVSSKSVFNPSGSVSDSAPMSIAHMTPAQLVSQLAARAKTLKQTDTQSSNQYRSPHNNYDYDERGGSSQQHGKNFNYRY